VPGFLEHCEGFFSFQVRILPPADFSPPAGLFCQKKRLKIEAPEKKEAANWGGPWI
jgi:hypothetical protein